MCVSVCVCVGGISWGLVEPVVRYNTHSHLHCMCASLCLLSLSFQPRDGKLKIEGQEIELKHRAAPLASSLRLFLLSALSAALTHSQLRFISSPALCLPACPSLSLTDPSKPTSSSSENASPPLIDEQRHSWLDFSHFPAFPPCSQWRPRIGELFPSFLSACQDIWSLPRLQSEGLNCVSTLLAKPWRLEPPFSSVHIALLLSPSN